jgi:hypothetical protein
MSVNIMVAGQGWIMKQAFYGIDSTRSIAVVSDAAVSHANNGEPKTVPYKAKKGEVYILKYNLRLPARGNQELDVGYRVRLDTKRLKASISVQAGESDVLDVGSAKCKVSKRK